MQFILTAFDGKDDEALARRNRVREQHLANAKKMIKNQNLLYAAAILNDDNQMIGSVMIVDFPSKEILINDWLNDDPYVTGNVWMEIDIRPCRVPDFILDTISP